MNIPKMPWYGKIESFLEPMQWLVGLLLLAIAAISIWLFFKGDNVVKTAWVTYVLSP